MENEILEPTKEELLKFDYPTELPSIIKVIGVGGGGGNAVTHMYQEGIREVNFALCNTDEQALMKSPVPVKLVLGREVTKGLGAGNQPDKAREAAIASEAEIKALLSDETRMTFITAGMGGGTGTGAGPVVAKVSKEMGILTIGIVTIPFMFESLPKIIQALRGVEEMRENVDALLVINNERLRDIYPDLDLPNAFAKADDTLLIAAKSISEIITIPGYINVDFADVNTTLKDGGVALMSRGTASGEGRVNTAIQEALRSPLLNNNDIFKAKKILLHIAFGNKKPLKMEEMTEVHNFMSRFNPKIELIWGTAMDDELEDIVKITILATGFGIENVVPKGKDIETAEKEQAEREKAEKEATERAETQHLLKLIEDYYGKRAKNIIGKPVRPRPFLFNTENMDDKDTIEAVIGHPSYNRSEKEIAAIIKRAYDRKQALAAEE